MSIFILLYSAVLKHKANSSFVYYDESYTALFMRLYGSETACPVLTRLRAERSGVRVPAMTRDISLLQNA
jgi:hypothetical protein